MTSGCDSIDGDLQVVARDVDLEDIFLQVTLLAERFHGLIVFRRHLLAVGRER
jgi:hypothetical protein